MNDNVKQDDVIHSISAEMEASTYSEIITLIMKIIPIIVNVRNLLIKRKKKLFFEMLST